MQQKVETSLYTESTPQKTLDAPAVTLLVYSVKRHCRKTEPQGFMLTDAIALEVEQEMKSILGRTDDVEYQTKHSLQNQTKIIHTRKATTTTKNPTLIGFKKKC